jgi:hypothetical protein
MQGETDRRQSDRVRSRCCICRGRINYLYIPANNHELTVLLMYTDINPVNICRGCGALRHVNCGRGVSNCPACGHSGFISALMTEDDRPITMQSGERVD